MSDEIELKKNVEKKRKKKHEEEQFEQSKKSKKKVKTEFTVNEITIKHWIEQRNAFKDIQLGWPHNIKLDDDDAILCLLCMALDFPNFPAVHYAHEDLVFQKFI